MHRLHTQGSLPFTEQATGARIHRTGGTSVYMYVCMYACVHGMGTCSARGVVELPAQLSHFRLRLFPRLALLLENVLNACNRLKMLVLMSAGGHMHC
jgi:hypothetical protein